jgi:hypothetical protein
MLQRPPKPTRKATLKRERDARYRRAVCGWRHDVHGRARRRRPRLVIANRYLTEADVEGDPRAVRNAAGRAVTNLIRMSSR